MADVLMNPLQSKDLVFESQIQDALVECFFSLWISKRSKTVLDGDEQNGCALIQRVQWRSTEREAKFTLSAERATILLPSYAGAEPSTIP
jgi:hypothetical protein